LRRSEVRESGRKNNQEKKVKPIKMTLLM